MSRSEIPDGWEEKNLGDCAFYINGYAFKPVNWQEHGVPIIRIEQMNDDSAKCDFFDKELPNKFVLQNGDLVFSWSATLSLKIWKRGKAYLNQHLFKVITKRGNDKLFLKYLIEFNLDKLAGEAHGSTMKHITRPHLLNYAVKTPKSFAEQQNIAHIIFTVDNTIDKTEELIEKNKKIKQGLMQDLFDWKNWDTVSLGSVAFVTKLAGFEYTEYFDYSKSGDIIAIRALNMKYGRLDLSDIHTIPRETSMKLPRSKLNKGDIVISYVGTIGELSVIPENEKYHLAPNVAKITLNKKLFLPEFALYQLLTEIGQRRIMDLVASTTQMAISMTRLRTLNLIKPPLEEQERIVKIFEIVDKKINSEESHLAKLLKIKAGLMQDLLTGRVRVGMEA